MCNIYNYRCIFSSFISPDNVDQNIIVLGVFYSAVLLHGIRVVAQSFLKTLTNLILLTSAI